MIAQLDREYMEFGKGFVLRRLMSYFLFEGRPHTTRGQWVNPFVSSFLKLLAGFPGEVTADRPIYITGLGRSGTTILGKLLSLHKDLGFLNEPKLMWAIADKRTDVCGDYEAAGGIFRLDRNDVSLNTRRTVNNILTRYAKTVGAKRVLDKYPEFIFRVDYLKEILPDVKIVFITRNGIDACASVANWSQQKGVDVDGRVDDWWGRNDVKWKYLCEQIIGLDRDYSGLGKLDLDRLDHLNRAALEWVITMRQGLNEEHKNQELIYRVSYESLVENPVAQLTGLMDRCELPIDNNVLKYAQKTLYKTPDKPKPVLVPSISELFEDTMQQMGYGYML